MAVNSEAIYVLDTPKSSQNKLLRDAEAPKSIWAV